jgi:hypothetical protein
VSQTLTSLSTPSGSMVANTGTGYLGNRSALDRSFDGQIDEVRIYNKLMNSVDASILPYLPATNTAPSIDAGTAQTITLPGVATLRATLTDDGNPSSVALAWSKVSGPGTVNFSPPNALNSSASFSLPGVYVLAITADDGQAKSMDEITVNVTSLRFTSVVVAGGNVGVTWASTPGTMYRVLYKDSLSEPTWREIVGDITASGSSTTFTEAVGFRTQRFYQVMEVQ